MPFGLAAAAVGVGGAIYAGNQQSSNIKQGQQQANAALSPYNAAGQTATSQEMNLEGLNGATAEQNALNTFQASPGYQYQLQQGLRAVDAGAAAQGMLRSGATLKAEQTLGTNLANQDFSNYYNRLSGLAGTGMQAAGAQAGVATGAATQQASIAGNQVAGVTNSVGGALGNTTLQNNLTGLFSGGGGSSNYANSSAGWNTAGY